jgi:hypothetical protein
VAAGPARAPDPTPLFKLIREIYVSGKSGHLHFTHGRERRSLAFVRGHIVHGTTDVEGEYLGQVLVRYGLISQPELEKATAIVLSERRRLGVVLHELGIMDRSRLEEAVSLHVREILFNVAGRGDGSYSFEEMSEEGTSPGLTAQIAPGQMILETARRLQSPDVLGQVLGDIDRTLVISSNARLSTQTLTLSPADAFVLSRVDGVLTAREAFQIIPLPQEDTERSLFSLLCTGLVEFLPKTATSRARASVEGERTPAPTPRPPAPAAAAAPPSPRREASPGTDARRRQITEAYSAIDTRDYFEFLGIPRDADDRQVKDAYVRMAKPFHPDSPLESGLAELRGQREAVFLHLGRVYETLRNAANRARYERLLSARSPRPAVPPPPAPAAERAPEVDAGRLAESAQEAARNGARLVKEGKYWDAIQLVEPALVHLSGPPLAKARVTLARAYMNNPNWLRRAEDALQKVLQQAPEYAEAYVVLGQVYRASSQRARAAAMYRRALELQPGNAEAQAELTALDPASGSDPGSGRLKKLFRKD